MKILLTIAVISLICGTGAFAGGPPGEVDFENFSNSLIYTNSVHNGPATGLITGDHAYYFMLLLAETNTTTTTHLCDTLATMPPLDQGGWSPETQGLLLGYSTATPGLMNGNSFNDGGSPYAASFDGPGEEANFAVVGWSANLGNDWWNLMAWWNNGNPTNGVAGWFGISDIAQDVVGGGGGYPIPTIFGPTAGYQVQGFTLNRYDAIPEPSALVLTGLGSLVLFLSHRCGQRRRPHSGNGQLPT
jgi:hypothetical protein